VSVFIKKNSDITESPSYAIAETLFNTNPKQKVGFPSRPKSSNLWWKVGISVCVVIVNPSGRIQQKLSNPVERIQHHFLRMYNQTQAIHVFGWVRFRKSKKMTVWLWSCHQMLWVCMRSTLPGKFRYNVWKSRVVLISKLDLNFELVMLKSKRRSMSVYWSCWKVPESRLTGGQQSHNSKSKFTAKARFM
jgi:hypothetical protein